MKTLTAEQFNALPEERRKYWEEHSQLVDNPKARSYSDIFLLEKTYTPIAIPLEDAVEVLEEIAGSMYNDLPIGEVRAFELIKLYKSKYEALTTALNNLKQLNK